MSPPTIQVPQACREQAIGASVLKRQEKGACLVICGDKVELSSQASHHAVDVSFQARQVVLQLRFHLGTDPKELSQLFVSFGQ